MSARGEVGPEKLVHLLDGLVELRVRHLGGGMGVGDAAARIYERRQSGSNGIFRTLF